MKNVGEFWRRMLPLMGIGLVLAGFPAAYGQDAEEASEESGFLVEEEIVVTAERRAEDINDVPLTITAFDSRLIEELGIVDEQDIEALTPGLQFGYSEEQTGQGTVIRGIGTRVAGANHMDMGVATYVDGVYSRTTTGVAPNLFDVERVEVARGPQGTLNGKNSIAGSINYVTKRPSREWDAQLLGEFTDQATQRVTTWLLAAPSTALSCFDSPGVSTRETERRRISAWAATTTHPMKCPTRRSCGSSGIGSM